MSQCGRCLIHSVWLPWQIERLWLSGEQQNSSGMVARHGAQELGIPRLVIWEVVQDTSDLFLKLSCSEGQVRGPPCTLTRVLRLSIVISIDSHSIDLIQCLLQYLSNLTNNPPYSQIHRRA